MPKVRTVLGDIEASELGFTMAHEHVIHCPRGLFAPDNEWALRDFNIQLQMVKDYKAIGGGTLVDAMCRDQDGRCPGRSGHRRRRSYPHRRRLFRSGAAGDRP